MARRTLLALSALPAAFAAALAQLPNACPPASCEWISPATPSTRASSTPRRASACRVQPVRSPPRPPLRHQRPAVGEEAAAPLLAVAEEAERTRAVLHRPRPRSSFRSST